MRPFLNAVFSFKAWVLLLLLAIYMQLGGWQHVERITTSVSNSIKWALTTPEGPAVGVESGGLDALHEEDTRRAIQDMIDRPKK